MFKIPSEVFTTTINLVKITPSRRHRRSKAVFECPSKEKTYLMTIENFNELLPQTQITGTWQTGTNSASNIIRPYKEPKRKPSETSKYVYFTKKGNQLLRKNSKLKWEGGAEYKIPKESFEAVLRFKTIFHRNYTTYAAFTLSRLDASLLFNADKELTFSMLTEDFAKLVKAADESLPQRSIAAIEAKWSFKGLYTSTLVCENIL